MDSRDLEVFLAVARHLNFTRAGEEMHLSQPSVSVRIRLLQEELGVKLFEQTGKRISLTEAGLVLEGNARRIVAAFEDAQVAMEELKGLERGSLKIGASTTPGIYLVPQLVAEFKRQHPKIEVYVAIKDTRQVEDSIVKNEFDFGFVGGHLIGSEVEVIPWRTDELALIVPVNHRFAVRKKIRPKDLATERFIFREQGSATQALVDSNLREWNLHLNTVMETDNPGAVKQAVQAGLGIAFVSKFAVETELKAKLLVAVKVEGLNASRELRIIHGKDKHLTRAAQAFIKACVS
jgi:LysR family transcriptional regulator, transcriptional activator of the cysJI operon